MAVGDILTQQYNETDIPVCYFSKWLNPMEEWWSIYERELYAII